MFSSRGSSSTEWSVLGAIPMFCRWRLVSTWLVVGEECQSYGDLKAGLSGRSRPSLVADYAIAGNVVPLLEP